MQERHRDRKLYFTELANTSREFYLEYVGRRKPLRPATRILEIGCGEGGNLLPFAEAGCTVTGIDINSERIDNARQFFGEAGQEGTFIASDFLTVPVPATEEERYDVVLVHDVIEHIEPPYKLSFMQGMKRFLCADGFAFFAFPAWQMPFGGHQQICRGFAAKLPFLHLLPTGLYGWMLRRSHETEGTINELQSIKRSRMPIERFERLVADCGMHVEQRDLWLINPHYKQKFHLTPRHIAGPFDRLPWLRNFYATSAWYTLSPDTPTQSD